jgi:hypothetical protein
VSSSDDDTKAILRRRARYVALALAGVGTATQATACVCLSPVVDSGDPYADADLDTSPPDAARASDVGLDAPASLDASGGLDAPPSDDAPSIDDAASDAPK